MNRKENIITLTKDIVLASKDFAEKVAPTTAQKHKERGHTGKTSPMNHFNGTIAEWAFHFWAIQKGGTCTKPDLDVYEARRKSYKEDLRWTLPKEYGGETINIHVKSQTEWSRNKYGNSYVFTKTDRINQLTGPNDYVALTYIHSSNQVEILQIVKGIALFPYFKLPKEEKYYDSKRAIYCDDFKHLNLLY